MRLNKEQISYLQILGHDLRPAVQVGAGGLTTFVLRQIDHALAAEELVRIHVPFGDKRRRRDILDALAPEVNASVVSQAGNDVVLFRRAPTPVIELPGAPTTESESLRAAGQAR